MALSQYLSKYAEAEVALMHDAPSFATEQVCVVPCYQESDAFIQRFLRTFDRQPCLLIIVINQPVSQPDTKPQHMLQEALSSMAALLWRKQNVSLFTMQCHYVLLVDRFSDESLRLPDKKGVGLARKIGADCASYLIAAGAIRQPWIYSTDADAHLPSDYFVITPEMSGAVALTFNFRHLTDGNDDIARATKLYEQRLHYYVDGLRQAGSGYAFHTIGSCLAFDANAYQQVRGFPQKSAGEDFYLLNKLAKLGEVVNHPACIHLDARVSQRVPFGTGPAVADIIKLLGKGQQYCVYHPQCFTLLRQLLCHLQTLAQSGLSNDQWQVNLPDLMVDFLQESGFFNTLARWRQQTLSAVQLQRQISGWMDAFRTLKFIHYCREHGFTDVPLDRALTSFYKN